jgi:hypothetical protein
MSLFKQAYRNESATEVLAQYCCISIESTMVNNHRWWSSHVYFFSAPTYFTNILSLARVQPNLGDSCDVEI